MEGGSEREAVTVKRAEIDTGAPFRSVREAVTMFGDIPVGGQRPCSSKVKMGISGKKLGSGRNYEDPWELDVEAELEETKYRLQKAREEKVVMEDRLCSLQEELERRKTELRLLKHTGPDLPADQNKLEDSRITGDGSDDEVDEISSVEILEDSAKLQRCEEGRNSSNMNCRTQVREEGNSSDDEKVDMMMNGKADDEIIMSPSKRYHVNVKGTVLRRVLGGEGFGAGAGMFVPQVRVERHPSLRRKKKKGLIPLIAAFFSKTKTNTTVPHEVA